MWKLYEIFKVLKIQKRVVSAEIIRGNTVVGLVKASRPKLSLFCQIIQDILNRIMCHFCAESYMSLPLATTKSPICDNKK